MKIFYSPYQLKAPNDLMVGAAPQRQGVLLKVAFEEKLSGYADCHPWTCLGDDEIEGQLRHLKTGSLTPLLACSLKFARIDAEARFNNENLFHNLSIPATHLLVPHLLHADYEKIRRATQEGFDRFKIKLGKKLEEEILALRKLIEALEDPQIKLRLDFGCSISRKQFEGFLEQMPLDKFDFFEDPFRFDPDGWQEVQEKFGVHLACDHESLKALSYPKSAQVLVVKPAVQNIESFLKDPRQLVVTSYVDHPVGVMCAAFSAAKAYSHSPQKIGTCGLLTHEVYVPDAFSSLIQRKGRYLLPPKGYGLGFDDLLRNVKWIQI